MAVARCPDVLLEHAIRCHSGNSHPDDGRPWAFAAPRRSGKSLVSEFRASALGVTRFGHIEITRRSLLCGENANLPRESGKFKRSLCCSAVARNGETAEDEAKQDNVRPNRIVGPAEDYGWDAPPRISIRNIRSSRQYSPPTATMDGIPNALPRVAENSLVKWFRHFTPYIRAMTGIIIVVVLPGELIGNKPLLREIIDDIQLLHGIGAKIVVVAGAQYQIDTALSLRGIRPHFAGAYRISDANVMEAALESAGRIRFELEAALSTGRAVPDLRRGHGGRWKGMAIKVASGNFVSAKRLGVLNGVDYGGTGEVIRVDVDTILERLEGGAVVLMSNLGYSTTGSVLNCSSYEIATATSIALKADKLICLLNGPPVLNKDGKVLKWLTLKEADRILRNTVDIPGVEEYKKRWLGGVADIDDNSILEPIRQQIVGSPKPNATPEDFFPRGEDAFDRGVALGPASQARSATACHRDLNFPVELSAAAYACMHGVPRVHLVDSRVEGCLLQELYTKDGVGTMVSREIYDGTRRARVEDLDGIVKLLEPLAEDGILVRRTAEEIADHLHEYFVVSEGGRLIACCMLTPFSENSMAELAAFAVDKACQGEGVGDALLGHVEDAAWDMGVDTLFLLTTRTADWFSKRGFTQVPPEDVHDFLPNEKIIRLKPGRNSMVLAKELSGREA